MTIAEKRNAGLHKNKIGHILWCILRALLFIGLSYIILYPILFCLSISVRLPSDMMDPTVIWLPKSFTLNNFKFVLSIPSLPPPMSERCCFRFSARFCRCFPVR